VGIPRSVSRRNSAAAPRQHDGEAATIGTRGARAAKSSTKRIAGDAVTPAPLRARNPFNLFEYCNLHLNQF
jgi:hypothetical protein